MPSSRKNRGSLLVFLATLAAVSNFGCGGGASASASSAPTSNPQPTQSAQLSITPSTVSVNGAVGAMSSQTVTASNVGNASLNISQVQISGTGFALSGLTAPLSLNPGQSQSFTVTFNSSAAGTVSGSLSFMSNATASPLVVPLQGTAAAAVTSVTISPAAPSAAVGSTVSFTATVQGSTSNTAVTWKAARGTITTVGVYTAPATAGTDTVTATSAADSTQSASATVTVTAAPSSTSAISSVTISPSPASAAVSGTVQFSATVGGTAADKSVTWKAASGTITSGGVYTAPAAAETDTVTATSNADKTKSASATVTVSSATVASVTVSPGSTSTTEGGTLQFSATVAGTASDKAVTWKATTGTISAGGVYTAPATAGTDTVTATSDADTSKSATATITVSAATSTAALPAFPGAGGGGAASSGGRGGQVIEVTNLNDSGTGSLRACLQATGPRTCVFRVAGIITPASLLKVQNPFLTIACQTAPGEIIIGGPKTASGALFISTHDVIVRYCTFSTDNIHIPAGPDTGTMNIEIVNGNNYNIIFDHITTRWAGNKLWLTLSNYVGPNHLITTQWSMFYEPHADHPVGPGTGTNPSCTATSSNPCFSSSEHDIDFHHNIFANMSHRIPESSNRSTRWVNNIVFNWEFYASAWLGAMEVDEIGNKYVPGNMNSGAQKHEIHFTTNSPPLPGAPSVYLSGNIGPNQSNPAGNQYAMASQITGENGDEKGPLPSSWIRSSPMAHPTFPIATDSVANLDAILLPTVGNSQHLDCSGDWVSHRDSADARIINQYKTGGHGGFWPNGIVTAGSSIPTPQAGWTDRPVTNFSACTESQHDGIPDAWKAARGLSTTDPNLHKEIAPNGYTYLENYINGPNGSASLTKPDAAHSTWVAVRPPSRAASSVQVRAPRGSDLPVSASGGGKR